MSCLKKSREAKAYDRVSEKEGGFRWGAVKNHTVQSGSHLMNKHIGKYIIKVSTFLFL